MGAGRGYEESKARRDVNSARVGVANEVGFARRKVSSYGQGKKGSTYI